MWRDLASDKKLARPSHNSTSVPESQLKKCAPVTTQKVCPVTTQKVCPSHNSKSVPLSQLKKCAPATTQKVCPCHNSSPPDRQCPRGACRPKSKLHIGSHQNLRPCDAAYHFQITLQRHGQSRQQLLSHWIGSPPDLFVEQQVVWGPRLLSHWMQNS